MTARSHLVLVGLMGSGKSSVGRLVADALQLPLVDVDDAIEARTGKGVAQLWREGGEGAYRPLERSIVVDSLDPSRPTVLAAPGGVVIDPEAVAAIAAPHVAVVYLRASPQVLTERIQLDPQPRPLVDSAPLQVLSDMHRDRDGAYEGLAHLVLDIDDLDPDQAAARILASGLLGPVPPS